VTFKESLAIKSKINFMRVEVFRVVIEILHCSGVQRCEREWLDLRHGTEEIPKY